MSHGMNYIWQGASYRARRKRCGAMEAARRHFYEVGSSAGSDLENLAPIVNSRSNEEARTKFYGSRHISRRQKSFDQPLVQTHLTKFTTLLKYEFPSIRFPYDSPQIATIQFVNLKSNFGNFFLNSSDNLMWFKRPLVQINKRE